MILPHSNSVKTRIILLFRKRASLTAGEIHSLLTHKQNAITLQAVYKELRGLIHDGVVHKIGKEYAISGVWILQLQAFAAGLSKTRFSLDSHTPDLPPEEKQTWTFANLLDLNDLWAHQCLMLCKMTGEKDVYAWNPYLWWYFFQSDKEDRLNKTLRLLGVRFFAVTGGASFLNLWGETFIKKNDNHFFVRGPGAFCDQMSVNYNVIGDYIISVRLSPKTHKAIHSLYAETKKFEDIDMSKLITMMTREGKATLKIEYSPKKAEKLRKSLKNMFL
ncbi:MAG: hypothetical protein KDJ50_09005 [Alphaproteobacteria bacterium]|nr:hypothetical protein [Alphaproteobacteria bacterium]